MDFIRQKGAAAFGTRLRRLSERLDREVDAIYRAEGVEFQPRWFPVVAALSEIGEASVGELAARLGITHVAISQVRAELVAGGLIRAKADPTDKRRQLLALSAKGRRYAENLTPLWTSIAAATETLLTEAAPLLLAALGDIEVALDRKTMLERVTVHEPRGKHALST
jgi:DNA-binding MarR family transcriptional regulator